MTIEGPRRTPQPMRAVYAFMARLCELAGEERVLDIGSHPPLVWRAWLYESVFNRPTLPQGQQVVA